MSCCSRVQQWMIDHSAITVVGIGTACVSGIFAAPLIPYKLVEGALMGSLIHLGFSSCSLTRRPRSNIRLLVGSVISATGGGIDSFYDLKMSLASLSWFAGTFVTYQIDQPLRRWLRGDLPQPIPQQIPQQEMEVVAVGIPLPGSDERPVMGG